MVPIRAQDVGTELYQLPLHRRSSTRPEENLIDPIAWNVFSHLNNPLIESWPSLQERCQNNPAIAYNAIAKLGSK